MLTILDAVAPVGTQIFTGQAGTTQIPRALPSAFKAGGGSDMAADVAGASGITRGSASGVGGGGYAAGSAAATRMDTDDGENGPGPDSRSDTGGRPVHSSEFY